MYDIHGKCQIHTVAEVLEVVTSPEPNLIGNATNRKEMRWFAQEVKKAFRGCEVRASSSDINHSVYHVYMSDDEYVMGWIDVDFDHAKEKLVYVVHSRDIQNNKYDNHSEGFRTRVSTLAHVGLKNAKKYLRRFSHEEVVLASGGVCRTVMRNAVEGTIDKYCTAWRQLFGTDLNTTHEKAVTPMLNEMYMLLDTGHEFIDKTIPDNLTSLRVTKEVKEQSDADMNMPMYAIRVYERLGKQAFDVAPLEDGIRRHRDAILKTRDANLEFATYYDDLPEGVMGKLSTLSICGIGDYVPQVGYRHSEAVFYVTQ
jgi:hypothetical protein